MLVEPREIKHPLTCLDDIVPGRLGVIACPMLEDELVYNLSNDPDTKKIYVLDNDYASSIKKKLVDANLDPILITNIDIDYDLSILNVIIIMNDLGLHEDPKVLKDIIENQVRDVASKFDVLSMYYGLCGNYNWDISKWAKDNNISTPVTVFRDCKGCVCDDCIGIAVGGCDNYFQLLKTYTGMLFLTPAMATNWDDFQRSMDIFKGMSGSSKEELRLILEMVGYKYAVKIDTGIGDREQFDICARSVAEETGLELITASDEWGTVELAEKLHKESKSLLN